ncbi:MAG: hypothetical protein ABL888_08930 [Pirellulaceae bacterium]
MCEISPCEDFENWIHEALDARQDPRFDQRIARHSRECPACAETLSDYVKVENLVAVAFSHPSAVAERQRIEKRRRTESIWRLAIGALAASILVLVVVERGNSPASVVGNSPDAITRSNSMPLATDSPSRQAATVSLATCYELTSELPGIRPIRSSVDATLNLIQQYVPASYYRQEPVKRPGLGGFNDGLWALGVA